MAAQSSDKSKGYVKGGLLGTRHQQLTALRMVKIPSGKAYNRQVRGATAKTVLKAIDSTINKNPSYWIPIPELVESTGLSESTVSAAIAVLKELSILNVTHRYEVKGKKRKQLPSRYQIVWSNLPDFIPDKITEGEPVAVIVEGDEAPAPPLSMSPPGTQCEGGVDSVAEGGGLSVSGGITQAECRTSPTSPDFSNPSPKAAAKPQKADGEGKLLFWQKAVAVPELLKRAVKKRDLNWLKQAWAEAVAAGWQVDTRDGFLKFLTAAFYVIKPPDRMPIREPARVLRQKLIESDWRTGCMDDADAKWAKETLRLIERPGPDQRTSNQAGTTTASQDKSRASQLAALQAFRAAKGV